MADNKTDDLDISRIYETSRISHMYKKVRAAPDTLARLEVFKQHGYTPSDLDNYNINPGGDPDFEAGWHRWLFLYQLTTGIERASILAIAFELHRSNPPSEHLYGVGFFSHGFTDDTRDMYYAKAMCIAYRKPTYDMDLED